MLDNNLLLGRLEDMQARRAERRRFMKLAATTTMAAGGLSLLAACGDDDNSSTPPVITPAPTPTPTPTQTTSDQDVLNFALNLEYLEAQFYNFAVTGTSIPQSLLSGTGTAGAPTGGRQVTFTDPIVAQYAREIAADELAHVAFLRTALGSTAVAQPALDISAAGAFSSAARAAGLITASQTFDPYASDENFLLAAFIFEDVGVSAYKGASVLLTNKTYLEAAAGILAAEAYHAGLIRTILYAKGLSAATEAISGARDSLDGPSDIDQGVAAINGVANIVPTDANGIVFSRSTGQVLNIAYLTNKSATAGGFFPVGVNGNVKASAAN